MDGDSQLTTTGMIIGTPHYMSPEQCRGEKIDAQSDIYSLGIVLYEMLTGDIPYRADSAAGVLVKHIQDPIPQLPFELQKYQPLLNRMIAKEKPQRIRSCAELLELLSRFAPTTPLDTIEASRPEKWVFDGDGEATENAATLSPYKNVKKSRPLAWVLFIILLIAGGAAAYYYLGYLPALQKKQAAQQIQPDEKEITVHEPDIPTPGKPAPQNKKGEETNPANKDRGSEINSNAYTQHLTAAEIYFKEGKIKDAREKLDQAKALAETPEVKALQKQINDYLAQEKQLEFDRYFSQANDFYKKGNYAKAKENIALAQKLKTTAELQTLDRDIQAKEEAARKKAEQERLQKKRDDNAYGQAVARNTAYAYGKYLEKYPSGRHAEEAQKRVNQLKNSIQLETKIQDDVAFEMAANKNNITAFESYLKQFPYGLHAVEARAGMARLREKIVKETKTKIELLHIKFFEAGAKPLAMGQRSYAARFSREAVRYIYTELKYKNILYGIANSTSRVRLEYSSTAGFGSQQLKGMIDSLQEAQDGYYCQGMGWPTPGKWPAGKYTITLYIDDIKLAQSQFDIY
jgi:hypothetical protein